MSSIFNSTVRVVREHVHDCNVVRLHLRKVPSPVYRAPLRTLTTVSPERSPTIVPATPPSSPWNVTVLGGDQKRTTVTVADLERQRDGRERVVILGSGEMESCLVLMSMLTTT